MTMPLFDAIRTEELKTQGMAQAADGKKSLLKYARQLAKGLAMNKGTITMDDVAFALHSNGISVFALGSAAGSVFVEKENGEPVWQWTGTFKKSVRSHSHGNLLREWRLRK